MECLPIGTRVRIVNPVDPSLDPRATGTIMSMPILYRHHDALPDTMDLGYAVELDSRFVEAIHNGKSVIGSMLCHRDSIEVID